MSSLPDSHPYYTEGWEEGKHWRDWVGGGQHAGQEQGSGCFSTLTTWVDLIIELSPLVHPNLGEARVVVVDDLAGAARERVRRGFAEHVPDMRARDDEQRAASHPDL